jgi:hypothetical protein
LRIISLASAGVIFGTAALAAFSICFTEIGNDFSLDLQLVEHPP